MRNWLKFMITLVSALALMLVIRTLAFSVHTISGNGLLPLYQDGDQLLVNRCSYGLRIEGNGLLPYSRLWRQPVKKGDIVAFTISDGSTEGICIARCQGVPGDTILTNKGVLVIPGLKTCADADYYWLEAINQQNPIDSRHLGFIHERNIMGRVMTVLFNRYHLSPLSPQP